MSLSIVTFANLGEKRNLKTSGIMPVIDVFIAHEQLQQIICQIAKRFYFPNTRSATPAVVRYPLRALEKLFGVSLSRTTTEQLFDFFAARKLEKVPLVLFHPALFGRTITAAKRNGSTTVGLVVTAHPYFAAAMYAQENKLLGLPSRDYSEAGPSKLVVDRFDYIIAVSDFAKKTCVDSGFSAERVFVAYTDVELQRFVPKKKDGPAWRVVYVAYTTPLKGLHYLLDAWRAFDAPDAELIIVGGHGDMPAELKRRYDAAVAADTRIKWVGDSRTPELYYQDASAFVFPSLTEGNPRAVMEAMACGLPVITTENARSIIENGKTGFVVPIRDATAIKEKIEYLYRNRDVAERMGTEARKAIEQKQPFGEAVYEICQDIMRRENKII